jgi:hypothetical protein
VCGRGVCSKPLPPPHPTWKILSLDFFEQPSSFHKSVVKFYEIFWPPLKFTLDPSPSPRFLAGLMYGWIVRSYTYLPVLLPN